MAGALFTNADYQAALLALFPRGRVWPRDPGSLQARLAGGFAPTLGRVDARAQQLLFDAFPANTVELLGEWEATLGLPDPCEGEGQTLEQRRAQVLIKLFDGGGQSIAYYTTVLSRLGYTNAVITEFAPFRVGHSGVGAPINGGAWWYVWNIHLPDARAFFFRVGVSGVGEPLSTYTDESVFCVLELIKPAHTIVTYSFGE